MQIDPKCSANNVAVFSIRCLPDCETQELTTQLETTTHLTEHTLAQTAATQQIGANGDHATNVTFIKQDRDRERGREQQGRQPSTPTTKIQDQSDREPSPQSVTKAPELSPATDLTAAIGIVFGSSCGMVKA
jgi:hypothetical protein